MDFFVKYHRPSFLPIFNCFKANQMEFEHVRLQANECFEETDLFYG